MAQSTEQLLAEIARLRSEREAAEAAHKAEVAALRKTRATSQPFKLVVTDKGGLSAYGLGRWPVTLYASQWRALLAHVDALNNILRAGKGLDKAGAVRMLAEKPTAE